MKNMYVLILAFWSMGEIEVLQPACISPILSSLADHSPKT